MELKQYLNIILKWKDIIIQVFLVTTFIALISSFIQRPVYESSVKLLIEGRGGNSSLLNDLAAGGALTALSRTGNPLDTQMELIRTNPVLEQVIAKLNLRDSRGNQMSAGALRGKISVSALRLTDIIEVRVQSNNPSQAAEIANAIGEVFVGESEKSNQREAEMARRFIEMQLAELQSELSNMEAGPEKGVILLQKKRMATVTEKNYMTLLSKLEEARIAEAVKIGYARIVEPATVPGRPIKPKKALNTFMGAFFGLVTGVGLVFLFEYLDDSIRTADDVKNLLNLPVLGLIPHFEEEESSNRNRGPGRHHEKIDAERIKELLNEFIGRLMRKDNAA